jgi:hypothetical protein
VPWVAGAGRSTVLDGRTKEPIALACSVMVEQSESNLGYACVTSRGVQY